MGLLGKRGEGTRTIKDEEKNDAETQSALSCAEKKRERRTEGTMFRLVPGICDIVPLMGRGKIDGAEGADGG